LHVERNDDAVVASEFLGDLAQLFPVKRELDCLTFADVDEVSVGVLFFEPLYSPFDNHQALCCQYRNHSDDHVGAQTQNNPETKGIERSTSEDRIGDNTQYCPAEDEIFKSTAG
jgi:hypothetical protein